MGATASNPGGGGAAAVPVLADCIDAVYGVVDVSQAEAVGILSTWSVNVGNTAFDDPNGDVAVAAFDEIYDPGGCWSRSGTTLIFTYTCAAPITVLFTVHADLVAVLGDESMNSSFIVATLYTAFADEGSTITVAEARDAGVFMRFTGTAGDLVNDGVQEAPAVVTDSIAVDTNDSIGMFLALAQAGDNPFDLELRNLLVTIEQVSPTCD